MPWVEIKFITDYHVRSLCFNSYPGHPRGCPNYKKLDRCPPRALLARDLVDLTRPGWAVYNVFALGDHVKKMREKHPSWTDRQLKNCLYWQAGARKSLRHEIKEFLCEHKDLVLLGCPEANGINVTATMSAAGVCLEWPPEETAHQVVMFGHGLSGERDESGTIKVIPQERSDP